MYRPSSLHATGVTRGVVFTVSFVATTSVIASRSSGASQSPCGLDSNSASAVGDQRTTAYRVSARAARAAGDVSLAVRAAAAESGPAICRAVESPIVRTNTRPSFAYAKRRPSRAHIGTCPLMLASNSIGAPPFTRRAISRLSLPKITS